MEGYNYLIQNLEIYRKDIINCYEDINRLITAQSRIKELYENSTVMNSIYEIFEKLNNKTLQVQKAKQYYILEKQSILEIEENEAIYSCRNSKIKTSKRNETTQKSIEYHSNIMGKNYIDYLKKEREKLKLMKEAESNIISLFNLLQTIYPNFNNNVTFKDQYNDQISFEEKASNITEACYEINCEELIKSIFTYTLNQTNREIEEKRTTIMNLLLGDSLNKTPNNTRSRVLKKAN